MKLRGAKKAAFLRRMAAGRKKARRRNPARTTGARTVVLKPITVAAPPAARTPKGQQRVGSQRVYLIKGPAGRLVFNRINPARRRRPTKKKRKQMAKLARNRKGQFLPRARNAAVANPKRRKAKKRRAAPARAKARRRKTSHRKPHATKRRRPSVALTVRASNPPARRRRRRRNPSFGGVVSTIKSSAMPMVVGGVAGLGAGFMDAKFLGSRPTVSVLAKVGLALLGAALLGRKRPLWAAGWAGGMIGSTGYHAGVKFGGGMVGLSPAGALKGIADMAAEDPEMANMIAGLGDVVDDEGGGALGDDAAQDYNDMLEDVVDAEEAYQ